MIRIVRSFTRRLVLPLAALVGLGPAGLAQPARSAQPGWLPTLVQFDNVSAADRRVLMARLREIERIVLATDELAHPAGFEVQPIFVASPGSDRGRVTMSAYKLAFYYPTKAIEGEGSVCVEAFVNPGVAAIHVWDQRPHINDAGGDQIFLEEQLGPLFPGATHVYGALSPTERSWYTALLTAGGESPFIPLTKVEYLEALIWELEGKQAKEIAEFRQSLATTPYQRWLAEAAQRKKDREQILVGVKALDPANAEKTRKTMEDSEREMGQQLKAAEAGDRARADEALRAPAPGDPIRKVLAALAPADRRSDAWVRSPWGYEFVVPGSPNAFHAVRTNQAFYRVRRSPLEARGVEVRLATGRTCSHEKIQRAIYQLYQQIDWAALARFLEPNR